MLIICSNLKVPYLSISPKGHNKHSNVFDDIPKGLPPICDFHHAIHIIPGSVPPNIKHYRYPYSQKSEIERMVDEMLEAGVIRPS